MGLVQLENANLCIILNTIIDQILINQHKTTLIKLMTGWDQSNQSNKLVLGGPYPLVALFSCLSFFFLSGLRDARPVLSVLLENIPPIFFL